MPLSAMENIELTCVITYQNILLAEDNRASRMLELKIEGVRYGNKL